MAHKVFLCISKGKCQGLVMLPKHVKDGHLHTFGAGFYFSSLIKTANPIHLVTTLGKLAPHTKFVGNGGKYVVIIAGLVLGLDDLLHRHNVTKCIVTELINIVTLIAGGGWQDNVSMTGSSRPLKVLNNKGI